MNRKWVCPACGTAIHAPERLAKLDTRRWCLRCSASSSTLIERSIPSKEAAKAKAAAARIVKTAKRREHAALADRAASTRTAELAAAFDRDPKDAAAWLRAWTQRLLKLPSLRASFRLHYPASQSWRPKVHIRQGGFGRSGASGHAWPWEQRLCVTTGCDAADDLSTLIHELAHLAAPRREHHGPVFQIVQREAIQDLTGRTIAGWQRWEGRVAAIRAWLDEQAANSRPIAGGATVAP